MIDNNDPKIPSQYVRYMEKCRQREDDEFKMTATRTVFDMLEAGTAIGLTLLPESKFTPQHAIELARFIYLVDSELRSEFEEEDETDETDGTDEPDANEKQPGDLGTS